MDKNKDVCTASVGLWDWKDPEDAIFYGYTDRERQSIYSRTRTQSRRPPDQLLESLLYVKKGRPFFGYNERLTNAVYLSLFLGDPHLSVKEKQEALLYFSTHTLKVASQTWDDLLPTLKDVGLSEVINLVFDGKEKACKPSGLVARYIEGRQALFHLSALLSLLILKKEGSLEPPKDPKHFLYGFPVLILQSLSETHPASLERLSNTYFSILALLAHPDMRAAYEADPTFKLWHTLEQLSHALAQQHYHYLLKTEHVLIAHAGLIRKSFLDSKAFPPIKAGLKKAFEVWTQMGLLPKALFVAHTPMLQVVKQKKPALPDNLFIITANMSSDFEYHKPYYAVHVVLETLAHQHSLTPDARVVYLYEHKKKTIATLCYDSKQLALQVMKPVELSLEAQLGDTLDQLVIKSRERLKLKTLTVSCQGPVLVQCGSELSVDSLCKLKAKHLLFEAHSIVFEGEGVAHQIIIQSQSLWLKKKSRLRAWTAQTPHSYETPPEHQAKVILHSAFIRAAGWVYSDETLEATARFLWIEPPSAQAVVVVEAEEREWVISRKNTLSHPQGWWAKKEIHLRASDQMTVSQNAKATPLLPTPDFSGYSKAYAKQWDRQGGHCFINGVVYSEKSCLIIDVTHSLLIGKEGDCRTARGIVLRSRQGDLSICGYLETGLNSHPEGPLTEAQAIDQIKKPIISIDIHCHTFTLYQAGLLINDGCYEHATPFKHRRRTLRGGHISWDTQKVWLNGQTYVPKGHVSIGANYRVVLGLNELSWEALKQEGQHILQLKPLIYSRSISIATALYINLLRRLTAVGGSMNITALIQFTGGGIYDGSVLKLGLLVLDFGLDFPIAPFEALLRRDDDTLKEYFVAPSRLLCLASMGVQFIKKFIPPVLGIACNVLLTASTLVLSIYTLGKQLPYLNKLRKGGQLQFHHILALIGSAAPLASIGASFPSLFHARSAQQLTGKEVLDTCSGILPLTSRTLSAWDWSGGLHVSAVVVNQSLFGQYHTAELTLGARVSEMNVFMRLEQQSTLIVADSVSMLSDTVVYHDSQLVVGNQGVISARHQVALLNTQVTVRGSLAIQGDQVTFNSQTTLQGKDLFFISPKLALQFAHLNMNSIAYDTYGWSLKSLLDAMYSEGEFINQHPSRLLSILTPQSLTVTRDWEGHFGLAIHSKETITVKKDVTVHSDQYVFFEGKAVINNGHLSGDQGVSLKGELIRQEAWYTYKKHQSKHHHGLRKIKKTTVEATAHSGDITSKNGDITLDGKEVDIKGSRLDAHKGTIYIKATDHGELGASIAQNYSSESNNLLGSGHKTQRWDDVAHNASANAKTILLEGKIDESGFDITAERCISLGDSIKVSVPVLQHTVITDSTGWGGGVSISDDGVSLSQGDVNHSHQESHYQTLDAVDMNVDHWDILNKDAYIDDHLLHEGQADPSAPPVAEAVGLSNFLVKGPAYQHRSDPRFIYTPDHLNQKPHLLHPLLHIASQQKKPVLLSHVHSISKGKNTQIHNFHVPLCNSNQSNGFDANIAGSEGSISTFDLSYFNDSQSFIDGQSSDEHHSGLSLGRKNKAQDTTPAYLTPIQSFSDSLEDDQANSLEFEAWLNLLPLDHSEEKNNFSEPSIPDPCNSYGSNDLETFTQEQPPLSLAAMPYWDLPSSNGLDEEPLSQFPPSLFVDQKDFGFGFLDEIKAGSDLSSSVHSLLAEPPPSSTEWLSWLEKTRQIFTLDLEQKKPVLLDDALYTPISSLLNTQTVGPLLSWEQIVGISKGVYLDVKEILSGSYQALSHPVSTLVHLSSDLWHGAQFTAHFIKTIFLEKSYWEIRLNHPELIDATYQAEHARNSASLLQPLESVEDNLNTVVALWEEGDYDQASSLAVKDLFFMGALVSGGAGLFLKEGAALEAATGMEGGSLAEIAEREEMAESSYYVDKGELSETSYFEQTYDADNEAGFDQEWLLYSQKDPLTDLNFVSSSDLMRKESDLFQFNRVTFWPQTEREPLLSKLQTVLSDEINQNPTLLSEKAQLEGWLSPFPPNTRLRKITTAQELSLFRVHQDLDGREGRFFVREKEIEPFLKGKEENLNQLKEYLGLRDRPMYITQVNVPAGSELIVGRIGAQPSFGLMEDSGFQYFSPEWLKDTYFGEPADIIQYGKELQESKQLPTLTP